MTTQESLDYYLDRPPSVSVHDFYLRVNSTLKSDSFHQWESVLNGICGLKLPNFDRYMIKVSKTGADILYLSSHYSGGDTELLSLPYPLNTKSAFCFVRGWLGACQFGSAPDTDGYCTPDGFDCALLYSGESCHHSTNRVLVRVIPKWLVYGK